MGQKLPFLDPKPEICGAQTPNGPKLRADPQILGQNPPILGLSAAPPGPLTGCCGCGSASWSEGRGLGSRSDWPKVARFRFRIGDPDRKPRPFCRGPARCGLEAPPLPVPCGAVPFPGLWPGAPPASERTAAIGRENAYIKKGGGATGPGGGA